MDTDTKTMINHWGKWVDPTTPVTGVISLNDVCQFVCDEMFSSSGINLTQESAEKEFKQDFITEHGREPDDQEWEDFYEEWESQPDDDWIIGSWKKDDKGLYMPDETGEYSAIVRESVIQVVWSKYVTSVANLCSPCYPGQADVQSGKDEENGRFLAYNLPPEAYEY